MKTLGTVARALLIALVGAGAVFIGGFSASGEEIKKPDVKADQIAAKRGKAEVLWSTTWYPAQVLEEKEGKFYIKYDGYGDNWNEWVGKDRIRFAGLPPARRQCEVEWHGTWFPAEVLKENEGKYFIKYDNYGENWNEWVGKERIRERARGPGKPAKDAAEVVPVEVESGGTWYPAKILEQKDGKFYVKYDGYTDASNEWVGKERIRLPAKAAPDKGRVEVEWSGKWYPATVLEKKEGKFYIKYDNWGETFNEWVGPERIRFAKGTEKSEGKP